jgi:hypothetical protein
MCTFKLGARAQSIAHTHTHTESLQLTIVLSLNRLSAASQFENGYDHNFALFGLDSNARYVVRGGVASTSYARLWQRGTGSR